MCGIGDYGAASELHEARQDPRAAQRETQEARQHFAAACEQFSRACQDFAHENIQGGIARTIAAEGFIDLALGFGGPGALGGFCGGLGPNPGPTIDPEMIPAGPGGSDAPSSGTAKADDEQAEEEMYDGTFGGLYPEEEEPAFGGLYE